jgi:hypothetical protein
MARRSRAGSRSAIPSSSGTDFLPGAFRKGSLRVVVAARTIQTLQNPQAGACRKTPPLSSRTHSRLREWVRDLLFLFQWGMTTVLQRFARNSKAPPLQRPQGWGTRTSRTQPPFRPRSKTGLPAQGPSVPSGIVQRLLHLTTQCIRSGWHAVNTPLVTSRSGMLAPPVTAIAKIGLQRRASFT